MAPFVRHAPQHPGKDGSAHDGPVRPETASLRSHTLLTAILRHLQEAQAREQILGSGGPKCVPAAVGINNDDLRDSSSRRAAVEEQFHEPQLLPPGLGMCPYGAAAGTRLQRPAFRMIVSVGTVGHPLTCKEPCVQNPCTDGAACTQCHRCEMQPKPVPTTSANQVCPSVGSLGHPLSCSLPCKFQKKGQNCKDGKFCVRCHLCTWQRKGAANHAVEQRPS